MSDVHTSHCCNVHGCKYGDPDCTVTTGKAPQDGPCEHCGLELEGQYGPEDQRAAARRWPNDFRAKDVEQTDFVELQNTGPVDSTIPGVYFPRLQVNKRGEIVLATSKHGKLTTGILVAKLPDSTSTLPVGKKFDDWEVGGELTDYDGEVTITLANKVKHGLET